MYHYKSVSLHLDTKLASEVVRVPTIFKLTRQEARTENTVAIGLPYKAHLPYPILIFHNASST